MIKYVILLSDISFSFLSLAVQTIKPPPMQCKTQDNMIKNVIYASAFSHMCESPCGATGNAIKGLVETSYHLVFLYTP